ncbi:cytochrome c [Pigmentiphaga aceris]|uniref:Cytochrome c n=1 Tax=Pigmentiphaga aceris TaxID=1940612 RepID=A0A5C0AZB7_9BURK|nr:cytochrome c [Pigmentiphaga aceris]QEI07802.1 cytochrome c [Pigmentiphaga aceris]
MRQRRFLIALTLAACATSPAFAGDVVLGKQKAISCAACHGQQGLSTVPDAPNLAGQPELYVVTQLKAYRSGTRRHEVMNLMAKPLTDDDIDNLAAWFGSLKIQVVQ